MTTKKVKEIVKKVLSVSLSLVLLTTGNLPLFSQSFNRDLINQKDFVAVSESTRVDATEKTKKIVEHLDNIIKQQRQNKNYSRAEQIKYAVVGTPEDKVKEFLDNKADSLPKNKQEFAQQYFSLLDKESKKAEQEQTNIYTTKLAEINKQFESYKNEGADEAALSLWKKENIDSLNQWKKDSLFLLKTYIDEQKNQIDDAYKTYQAKIEEVSQIQADKYFADIKPLISELIKLYQKDPQHTKMHLLEITNIIAGFKNSKKETLYNQEEAKILLDLYRDIINQNIASKDSSCKKTGLYCSDLLSAIFALGVMSEESKDAYLLRDVLEDFYKTPASVQVVLNTLSALLMMKEYSKIDSFLYARTQEENKNSISDYLSFGAIPEAIANSKGQYLGSVSELVQYSDEEQYSQNLYYDIALILAEDGSAQALKLLKKYGVDKCIFMKTDSIDSATGTDYRVVCNGIQPFLAGALVSKKSGADKYELKFLPAGQQVFMKDGSVRTITQTEAQNAIVRINNVYKDFNDLAKVLKLNKQAVLAFMMINKARGDIDEIAEYSLDKALFDAYKDDFKNKTFTKYAIINSDNMMAKKSRYKTTKVFKTIAFVADIAFTIYCFWDLGRLGIKLVNFSKTLFVSFRAAKLGTGFKQVLTLPTFAAKYSLNAIKKQNWYANVQKVGKNVKSFNAKMKANMAETTVFNRELFVSAKTPLQELKSFSPEPRKIHLTRFFKDFSYNKELGSFLVANVEGVELAKQQIVMQDIFDVASTRAKNTFYSMKPFKQKFNPYSSIFAKELKSGINKSKLLTEEQKFEFLGFVSNSLKNNIITGTPIKGETAVLKTFVGSSFDVATEVPIQMSLMEKLHGVKSNNTSSVLLSRNEEGGYMLRLVDDFKHPIDPSSFKMQLNERSLFPFTKASFEMSAGGLEGAKLGGITLKFLPQETKQATFWRNNFTNLFKKKEKIFSGTGKVFLEEGGQIKETDILLKTYKEYDGMKLLVSSKGTQMSIPNMKVAGNVGNFTAPLSGRIMVPKSSLTDFLKISTYTNFDTPFNVALSGATNKLNTLYLLSTISLGVASTGIVGPLKDNYPDINATQLLLISSILPYSFSFLAPFVAPFVKRYGAADVLKVSMGLSLGSLGLAMGAGFHGFGGIQPNNPFGNPSPNLLFPSAAMISLSSMLKSSSFSPLIQAVGGGGNTLKAKAFKSLSSFALILPPAIAVGINEAFPKYYKNPDGSLYLGKDGNPVQRSVTDFAISYPIVSALTAVTFYKLLKSNFSSKIASVEGYKIGGFKGLMKEGLGAYGTLLNKEMLPLTLGSFFLAGGEDILLYSYLNAQNKDYFNSVIPVKEFSSVAALLALNLPPFLVRMKSSKILAKVGGDTAKGYKNLLGLSLGVSATGLGISMMQDSPEGFATGMLVSTIGFSQITNGILRGGALKLKNMGATKSILTNWNTSYPLVYFGYSAIPLIYSKFADREVNNMNLQDDSYARIAKRNSLHDNLWVGATSFALGAGFTIKGIGGIGNVAKSIEGVKTFSIPTGTFGIAKGLFGSYKTPFDQVFDKNDFPIFTPSDLHKQATMPSIINQEKFPPLNTNSLLLTPIKFNGQTNLDIPQLNIN